MHARLIQRLHQLGARAVVFDVLLEEAGPPEAGQRLVDAVKTSGPVAMAAVVQPVFLGGDGIGWETRRAFPALAAVTSAGVVAQADRDQAVRRDFFNPTVTNLPSLAACAAGLSGGEPPPVGAERWINYYGPPGFLSHLSYVEALEREAAWVGGLVSNRVVYVGAALDTIGFTGGRNTDDFRTPYTWWTGRRSPGVEINATCYLNVVRREWLNRLSPGWEISLVFAVGAGLGLALGGLRLLTAIGVGFLAAIFIAGAAMVTAWAWHWWVPWAICAGVQLPIALAGSVVGQSRRALREKRAFEQALALASEGKGTPPAGLGMEPGIGTGRPIELPPLLQPAADGGTENQPRIPDHDLLRCIGRGGYGEVWLARDILGSLHAVKVLRLSAFSNAGPLLTEFEGLRRYTPLSRSHPGLVHILHVGRDSGDGQPSRACLYYVMELADDEAGRAAEVGAYAPRTLAQDLARRGRLPLDDVLRLGAKLADALEYLHRHQLVHRDVKPANIVFVKGEPKLADIGLVTDAAAGGNGLAFLGTPGRIAPEGAGTPAADVYSLGKLLYEAGLGMPVERFPELPADMLGPSPESDLFELNRILMKACHPDPRHRAASAREVGEALTALGRRRQRARPASTEKGMTP